MTEVNNARKATNSQVFQECQKICNLLKEVGIEVTEIEINYKPLRFEQQMKESLKSVKRASDELMFEGEYRRLSIYVQPGDAFPDSIHARIDSKVSESIYFKIKKGSEDTTIEVNLEERWFEVKDPFPYAARVEAIFGELGYSE